MTRAAQRALVIMAALLVVIAGLWLVVARQQSAQAERNACIVAYRSQWERSIGDIVVTAAADAPVRGRQVRRLDAVQHDLARLDDRCPLRSWWQL